MNRVTKTAIGVLGVLIALIAFKYFRYTHNEEITQNQIETLQSSMIGTYFDAFVVLNHLQKYDKSDFLNFVREFNKDLAEILDVEEIVVRDLYGMHSIYHIGKNQVDDDLSKDDVSVYISTVYGNIQKDWIYTLESGKLVPLNYFNVDKLIAKTIPCDNIKNVKYNINADYFPRFDTLLMQNNEIKFSKQVDSRIVDLARKDSLINQYSKEYNILFSIFSYEPIDSFYCDSVVSNK